MVNWFEDNSYSIGNTPLVRINKITKGAKAHVFAKIEGRNPAYSVKCRIGASMIWEAEVDGHLGPGREIVEPTSGNTGIALAFVGAARGYPVILTMPATMSIERRRVLTALGAKIVLTPGEKGMRGSIDKAEEIVASDPSRYFMPQQFKNPANPAIHEKTTGPEIWDALDGKIDVLVAGVGTGGTITGISRFIKCEKEHNLVSVAVEPSESPVLTQTILDQELKPSTHKIQGIGAGFVPDVLDMSLIDRVETIDADTSIAYARRLMREEGILCGISCGAAMAVADRLARMEEFDLANIVVILPDAAERYLSTVLFENIESGGVI